MNGKRIIAAVLSGLLAASAALGMTSCAKQKAEPKKEKRTNVYQEVMSTRMPDGVSYIQRSVPSGDFVYLLYRTVYTYTYDEEGNLIKKEPGYHWDDSSYYYPEEEIYYYVSEEADVEDEPSEDDGEGDALYHRDSGDIASLTPEKLEEMMNAASSSGVPTADGAAERFMNAQGTAMRYRTLQPPEAFLDGLTSNGQSAGSISPAGSLELYPCGKRFGSNDLVRYACGPFVVRANVVSVTPSW